MESDGREWRERMDRLEKSIQELRDAQLVQVHLMDRHEREWHEQSATLVGVVVSHEDQIVALRELVRSHEDGMAELREVVRSHEDGMAELREVVRGHQDGIVELRAAMTQLFQRMDRFIQGLERENGHKGARFLERQ